MTAVCGDTKLRDAEGNPLIAGRWYVEEIDEGSFGAFWFWDGARFNSEVEVGEPGDGESIQGFGNSGVMWLQVGNVERGYESVVSA